MEAILQAILGVLNKIYDLIFANSKTPKLTQGGLVRLKPNKQENVEIEVPDEWADDWTIYCTPSDNYYALAASKTGARVKVKIEDSTGKSVMRHNTAPRSYDPTATPKFTIPGLESNMWLDSYIVGESFHVSGKKVVVNIRNVTNSGTDFFDFEVSASKGSPKLRTVADYRVDLSPVVAVGRAIPRFAKRVKFLVVNSTYDISDLPALDFVDITNSNYINIDRTDWPLLASSITFDGAGNPIMVSRISDWIDIPSNCVALKFAIDAVGISVIPVWEIYE